MARKLIVCLDGTGNEIGSNLSNVMKLYRMLIQDADQLVYYDPGVGTIGQPGWWSQLKEQVRGVLGLVLGLGLDDNVLDAYAWLCRNYRDGDQLYFFGFSRGAYTARVLAGFIHMCGLLRPDQLNLCGYALVAYKKAADTSDVKAGFAFGRIAGSRRATIRFVGLWDSVASLLVPRADRLYLPALQKLPYTRRNPSVRCFRHAISMDERRRMFRLNHWIDPQMFAPDPFDSSRDVQQDVAQVWFAGVHSDVGGGYPEADSGLSKYPLLWMIGELRDDKRFDPEVDALRFDARLLGYLAAGARPADASPQWNYVPPSATATLHRSLAGPWWLLEALPKYYTLQEWPQRRTLFDFYLPWAEPRPIPNRPRSDPDGTEPFCVHSSVLARIAACPDYRPVNLPVTFQVESAAGPPPVPIPPRPYRPEGALALLRGRLTRLPPRRSWAPLLGGLFGLFLILLVLDRLDLLPWNPDLGFLLGLGAVAALGTALGEEALFRGLLLKPPSNGATDLGPAALSAALFAFWHALQTYFYDPLWASFAWSWWFLLGTALLGFVCAKVTLATRSLWPAVVLHWLVALGWKALYGVPSCGRLAGVLCN